MYLEQSRLKILINKTFLTRNIFDISLLRIFYLFNQYQSLSLPQLEENRNVFTILNTLINFL